MKDIAELEIPETATVHIEFPGKGKLYADETKEKPVLIEVYGPSSDAAIKYKRKMTKEVQERMAKRGAKKGLGIPSEELEERDVERLVTLTAGVFNLTFEGENITPQNIRKIYENPKLGWLTDQVREKLGDWEDFLS